MNAWCLCHMLTRNEVPGVPFPFASALQCKETNTTVG